MNGVAVNVTDVPAQNEVADADICTESVPVGFTVSTIVREVAVAGDTQVPDGVITQVILCVPAVSDDVANDAPVPILVVPSFH